MLLVAIVVGSGIAAQQLTPDDVGLQLLENSLATAAGLAVLIMVLAPVSGAHFNPVVSVAAAWFDPSDTDTDAGERRLHKTVVFIGAQIAGGVAEVVATAGLVLVIFGLTRGGRGHLVPGAVGMYIGTAYWFTGSTSFANPAVTIGRMFSDTFAGTAPVSAAPFIAAQFIAAQFIGAGVGVLISIYLFPRVLTDERGSTHA